MKLGTAPGVIVAMALALPAFAAEEYVFDKAHTQILFEYDHLGYSITQGTFTDGTAR